jgi:ribulose 1,5-bisphosphate synthetase/thiazole synthase
MQDRATDILDKLHDLKIAILNRKVTIGHMVSIADVIATHRETIQDPALTSILDEIDLRAHVELAKLKVAESQQF